MSTQKLFSPSYLKSLCSQYSLTPSKRYGQNYLVNPEPIVKIIEQGNIKPTDNIIEVGPGFGVLTFALATKAKKVYAFEIEKKLEQYWQQVAPNNVKVIWGNILKVEIGDLGLKQYKVIANLPYQITSAVMRKFLESNNPPTEMILMVQKEVAERICAKPGDMSLLAVSVQYYAKPEIVMQVPRSYFWPEPKVDSAVIKLRIKNEELRMKNNNSSDFFRVVKSGFASKRKMLLNNLITLLGKDKKENILEVFRKVGLSEKVRAEELSMDDWILLVKIMEKFHI